MIRRIIGPWLAMLLAPSALAQGFGESFDEETAVKLGKPAISQPRALQIARSFFAEIGLAPQAGRVTASLRSRIVSKHVISSQWAVLFPGRIEVRVSGQTGRVLRFADLGALERISRVQMFSRKNMYDHAVQPKLLHAPQMSLSGDGSSLLLGGRAESPLAPNGWYIEQPHGLELVGAEDRVVFQFDPKNGRLILFERALDLQVKQASAKISASRAQSLASKVKANSLRKGTPAPHGLPRLVYAVVPHPRPKRSEYHAEMDRAIESWQVVADKSEVWIDASTGRVIGGITAR